jgi:hypothetical protein
VSGPSSKNEDQRKAERELRKQERRAQGHQGKGQLRKAETRGADASPGPSAAAIPIISPSATESPEKGEKNKRKRERTGIDESG